MGNYALPGHLGEEVLSTRNEEASGMLSMQIMRTQTRSSGRERAAGP